MAGAAKAQRLLSDDMDAVAGDNPEGQVRQVAEDGVPAATTMSASRQGLSSSRCTLWSVDASVGVASLRPDNSLPA